MTVQRLWAAFQRVGLPVWFLLIDSQVVGPGTVPGGDAIIYARGARAFLDGGNPWTASLLANGQTYHFAGLPPAVIAFVPFALLPEAVTAWIWVGVSIAAAVLTIRWLKLPWWYIAFPPIVQGAASGNPQIALLALLLIGAGPVAAVLKVYAIVPLAAEGRWRALGLTALVFGATVVVTPGLWLTYLSDFGAISATLAREAHGGFSAWAQPWPMLLASVIALLIIMRHDRRAAGWLAVPALWPASEYHYATLILPIATPALAFAMAIPWYGVPALVTVGYAAFVLVKTYGKGRWPSRGQMMVGAA